MKGIELNLTKGKNNFEFIRFLAAFLVFIEHSFSIFTGKSMEFDLSRSFFRIGSGALGVAIFFALSGFLVAHSFINSKNIWSYFLSRFVRILPALCALTVLSIFILGIFFSEQNFFTFLKSEETKLYFQNCLIFRTYYSLPGVFVSNIYGPSTNGSLWTIPYEFYCYLILPFMFLLPFIKSTKGTIFIFILLLFSFIFFEDFLYQFTIPILGVTMKSLTIPLLYFMSGLCYYKLKESNIFNRFSLLIVFIVLLAITFDLIPRIFLTLVLPYLILLLAFSKRINLNNFGRLGDFSYGFYLYAFPVQQAVCNLFFGELNFYFLVLISFLITLFFGFFSWFLIEKPSLNLKSKILAKLSS